MLANIGTLPGPSSPAARGGPNPPAQSPAYLNTSPASGAYSRPSGNTEYINGRGPSAPSNGRPPYASQSAPNDRPAYVPPPSSGQPNQQYRPPPPASQQYQQPPPPSPSTYSQSSVRPAQAPPPALNPNLLASLSKINQASPISASNPPPGRGYNAPPPPTAQAVRNAPPAQTQQATPVPQGSGGGTTQAMTQLLALLVSNA